MKDPPPSRLDRVRGNILAAHPEISRLAKLVSYLILVIGAIVWFHMTKDGGPLENGRWNFVLVVVIAYGTVIAFIFFAWLARYLIRRRSVAKILNSFPSHGFCEFCFYAAPDPLPNPPTWTCPECGQPNSLAEFAPTRNPA
jgi:hypothetical protein